ncbi:unnamed protein product, partial [Mesorhabditis spiculigera]
MAVAPEKGPEKLDTEGKAEGGVEEHDSMLPLHHPSKKTGGPEIHLLGVNLTNSPKWLQFVLLSLAIFVFYLGYGYMQELIFRLDGMKPFGWYLTLLQFVIYSGCGYGEGLMWHDSRRRMPLKIYAFLAFLTMATMGLSNASVGYLNYPTQVIFKCCKLIPVLIGGILIQGKRYGLIDVSAAILMSIGLIMFTLADSRVAPVFELRGYRCLTCGCCHWKCAREKDEAVLYSYSIGAIYIFAYTVITGEFFSAFAFFLKHPYETYGYGIIFGLLGYLGVNVVLTLIKVSGALVAVTVTTLRKALTIMLSFILFAKPFTADYIWAGMVILLAIYLNLYSKNKTSWDAAFGRIIRRYIRNQKHADINMV